VRQRILYALLVLTLACSSEAPESNPEGAWVGTITTDGDVTTVVNESGSVWGGPATLVEEASIGVESGDANYMFARLSAIYATEDEIYVLDNTPALRVFDYSGTHLRNIGGVGQGPGEFQRPNWVGTTPDGRLFVADGGSRRINVYGPSPGMIDSWPMGRQLCCLHPMVVTSEGVVWLESGVINEQRRAYDPAYLAHGPDGPADEPFMVPAYDYRRWTLTYDGREIDAVPYAPEIVHAMTPAGLLLAGSSDTYRFEIISPDGPKTVVERYWDPVTLSDLEIDYETRSTRSRFSANEAGTEVELVWDGRLPPHKPAFRSFLPTADGDIWVIREGPGRPIEDCDPSEMVPSPLGRGPDRPRRCSLPTMIIDAFDGEGRYLGEVDFGGRMPVPSRSVVIGGSLITESQDEAGTIIVKRHRLVLAGEE
jgi:hypothetical protein